jgi:hypothetical protein
MLVSGEGLYGRAEQVPGQCFVATKFVHFCFFPIVPLGSFLVVESAAGGFLGYKGAMGYPLCLSWKSISFGYFRAAFATAALLFLAICLAVCDPNVLNPHAELADVAPYVVGTILLCPTLLWLTYWLSRASPTVTLRLEKIMRSQPPQTIETHVVGW